MTCVTPPLATLSLTLLASCFAVLGCGADSGGGADECTYENGRTYMEEYNHCQRMQERGIQCIVPAPPVC